MVSSQETGINSHILQACLAHKVLAFTHNLHLRVDWYLEPFQDLIHVSVDAPVLHTFLVNVEALSSFAACHRKAEGWGGNVSYEDYTRDNECLHKTLKLGQDV